MDRMAISLLLLTVFSVSYDRLQRSREKSTKIKMSLLSSASRKADPNGSEWGKYFG